MVIYSLKNWNNFFFLLRLIMVTGNLYEIKILAKNKKRNICYSIPQSTVPQNVTFTWWTKFYLLFSL